ncbi:MAG: hypothetical protein M3N53_04545 [Actinomycetota bacterium]|nr:hypothetical protein [Actinomycetota bacterium]
MDDERSRAQRELEEEAEHLTGGPGVVASKTQARGSLAGLVGGLVVGAILGAIVGVLFFQGTLGIVISVIAFATGGATFGGLAGGSFAPRKKLEGSEADV